MNTGNNMNPHNKTGQPSVPPTAQQPQHAGGPLQPMQVDGANSANGNNGNVAQAPQGNLLYDLSSFADPLQAHALQLAASAGLTNILAPAPGNQHQHPGAPADANSQAQHAFNLIGAAGQGQQATTPAPHPYYFAQNQAGAPAVSGLQPIAPSNNSGAAPQPAPGYILPAAPAGYPQAILPGGLGATPGGAPGSIPGLLMSQHLQAVVANAAQHPAPLAPLQQPSSDSSAPNAAATTKTTREMAPSVVSSSTTSTGNKNSSNNNNFSNQEDKPPQEASQEELDRMTPAERRRYERNLREQQRSYKISQQIKELRDVLSESNVPFKPNKYSILLSVVDYIKQLQARAIMLDAEHQKLITTLRQTNDMIATGTTPSSADETDANNTSSNSDSSSDNEMLFVQGLDYRSVFSQCPAALGVAALDGRILECNPEFQALLGFPRETILKQSLFNLVQNHQDIFRAMAEMLKVAEVPGASSSVKLENRFWSGEVVSSRNAKLSMNLTLTVTDQGAPKFFNCT
eukprot:CAMPEP_0176099000 /NCGR_PEP_ID=MMETSP0120_2-20121206/49645_1 /TAXON_ID=160619 /ORGANISM="Kryptoperidinium foliaceum, Strain CCMP 1326" /LENGTH=515 /DNA_ID=CAMNT_0017433023 /DNA_START=146 /DNA_END=1689 /DNA_ORIENTATION=+